MNGFRVGIFAYLDDESVETVLAEISDDLLFTALQNEKHLHEKILRLLPPERRAALAPRWAGVTELIDSVEISRAKSDVSWTMNQLSAAGVVLREGGEPVRYLSRPEPPGPGFPEHARLSATEALASAAKFRQRVAEYGSATLMTPGCLGDLLADLGALVRGEGFEVPEIVLAQLTGPLLQLRRIHASLRDPANDIPSAEREELASCLFELERILRLL